ncbi:hypothetical protein FACS189435_1390 [Bacteroidia bacterium]|nr:hypothetical protein FACS189435_1390 [Bacteroidia bacterium]
MLCLLLFLACQAAAAQEPLLKTEYSYRRYTTQDGLPGSMVECLFQDSRGYIWLGLKTGLARFDGTKFQTIIHDAEVSIRHIVETSDRQIRAFSHRTMFLIQPDGTFERKKMTNDKALSHYQSLQMPEGYVVYQTADLAHRSIYALSDTGLVENWRHDLFDDSDDLHIPYWDTKNRRIYFEHSDSIRVFDEDARLLQSIPATKWVMSFVPCPGGMWVLAADGIYDLRDGKLQQVYPYPFSLGTLLYGLVGRDGELIILDSENIYQYAGGKLETLYTGIAYPSGMIQDREGNLWVSSYEGLYCFFNRHFKNYILPDKSDVIRSVLVDNDDRLWIGSLNGKLLRLAGSKTEEIDYPAHPLLNFFHPFPASQGEALYFNSPALLAYSNGKFQYANIPVDAYIFTAALPDGNLVSASNSRVILYTPAGNILKEYTAAELLQNPRQAAIDKQGRIWVTGMNGITLIDGSGISMLPGLAEATYLLIMDKDGNAWFTAGNRLCKYENDSIRTVHTFGQAIINGLHITKGNILVVVTDKGIYLSPPESAAMKFYNHSNGFTGEASFKANIAEDKEGYIYVMTMEHLTGFNPRNLLYKQPAPLLYVEAPESSADNIHWSKQAAGQAAFDYKNRNIRFACTGICYSATGNLSYYYRLRGFQEDWSEPSKLSEMTFNNLPPGNYTFEVFADAGTGESRSEIQSFPFTIRPAFWQTAWFIILCAALLMLASAGAAIFVQRRKNKALLERLRAEKTLNELRISSIRLKAIPHFNANVLSAIEYYIANRTKEEAMRILGIYSDFTFKTLSEVDKAARPLAEELAYVKMYLDLEKIRFMDKFDFRIQVEDEVNKEVQLPNMILHTYCENAVKHGLMPLKSGGLLTIHVSQRGKVVCVSVEDNGVGRASAGQNPHLHSSKQGLSILNQQIEIYNRFNREKIVRRTEDLVNGGKPAGTRFTVEIPTGFAYIN